MHVTIFVIKVKIFMVSKFKSIDTANWTVEILNSCSIKNIMMTISEKELVPGKNLLSYLIDFLKRGLRNVFLFSFVSILADCLLSALFVHQLKNG